MRVQSWDLEGEPDAKFPDRPAYLTPSHQASGSAVSVTVGLPQRVVGIAPEVQFANFAPITTRAALLDCFEHFATDAFDRTKIKTQPGHPAAQKVVA